MNIQEEVKWCVSTCPHDSGRLFIEEWPQDTGEVIATIAKNTPRHYADASLIASAPELLQACRSALAEINQCQAHNLSHPTLEAAAEYLRNAIHKATI